jgi:hypothetical protein
MKRVPDEPLGGVPSAIRQGVRPGLNGPFPAMGNVAATREMRPNRDGCGAHSGRPTRDLPVDLPRPTLNVARARKQGQPLNEAPGVQTPALKRRDNVHVGQMRPNWAALLIPNPGRRDGGAERLILPMRQTAALRPYGRRARTTRPTTRS